MLSFDDDQLRRFFAAGMDLVRCQKRQPGQVGNQAALRVF